MSSSDVAAWVQGVGSLLAVVVALRVAFDQRAAARKDRQEDRVRAHQADRPLLVFALDATTTYCTSATKAVVKVLSLDPESEWVPGVLVAPSFPEAAVRDIARVVASMPAASDAVHLVDLLRRLQVTSARLRRYVGCPTESFARGELEERLLDSLMAQAKADTLFAYARYETDTPGAKVTAADLRAKAMIAGIFEEDEHFADLFKRIARCADF